jgi:Putative transposase DNA-binding domain
MLSKHCVDAAFGQFVTILKWVAWKRDVFVAEVDKNYTSQICPNCGSHTGKVCQNFKFFLAKISMNRVKNTTTNLNSSVVEVSVRTPQVRSSPLSELSSKITDSQALQNSQRDDPASPQTVARASAGSSRRRPIDRKASSVYFPQASSVFLKWLLERLSRSKGWISVLTIAAVWGWWNSQLLVSTGFGIGAMLIVYRAESWDWQLLRSKLEQFWDGPKRRLVLAVASGGIATLGTYMSWSIWADSESPSMAASAILQNVGTIAIVALLLRQLLNRSASKDEAVIDRILADLTDNDPVKRLIAVRQITDLVNNQGFWPQSSIAKSHATECFRLMLSREPEALVRNALLESLQALDCYIKTRQV